MKRLLILAVLIFVGVAGWRLGDRLSPDALGMAIGIVFGVMASIPAALLVLAAGRRADGYRDAGAHRRYDRTRRLPAQPPVVVVTAPPMNGYAGYPGGNGRGYDPGYMLPAGQQVIEAPADRQFKVVGEEENWIDDY